MQTQGLTAKGVPKMAPMLLYLRMAIIALSVIVLASAAASIGIARFSYGAPGYMIFIVRR